MLNLFNLEYTHPWLYQRFVVGLFVARHSEMFWAGFWPDLSIEWIIMRALKSDGRLTHLMVAALQKVYGYYESTVYTQLQTIIMPLVT